MVEFLMCKDTVKSNQNGETLAEALKKTLEFEINQEPKTRNLITFAAQWKKLLPQMNPAETDRRDR